jgi:hypothetical protein
LPGGAVRGVDASFSTLVNADESFPWPFARRDGIAIDLRAIPPESAHAKEFLYVSDLSQRWCGVEDLEHDAAIRLTFESELPFVWLFLSYGGWRNLYTAVLEPCTNMPKDLAQAAGLHQAARLEPGREFTTEVSVALSRSREWQL